VSQKPYPEYTASGVDWVRAPVPAHWATVKLGRLAKLRSGAAIDSGLVRESGPYPVYGGGGFRGYTDTFTNRRSHVLVGRQGALCGNTTIAHGPFFATEHSLVAHHQTELDIGWLAYNFEVMDLGQYAQSAAQPGLSADVLHSKRTIAPPVKEQRAIAEYLNRETAEINAFIAEQEELIALLAERRAATALRATLGREDAVNRGLLGRFLTKINRPAIVPGRVVTAFRDGAVTARSNRREEGFTVSASEVGYQGVAEGDFVFHGLDGFSGATGVSDSVGNCSPVYHVCAVNKEIDAEYAALYIRALGSSGFLGAYAWSVRQRAVDYRNWGVFSKLPVAFPGLEQQQDAVRRFQTAAREMDDAISDAREAIALSKERRAALISAAVTGKIDVRNHGGVE
jgi:type I restriction enzyme S subunit